LSEVSCGIFELQDFLQGREFLATSGQATAVACHYFSVNKALFTAWLLGVRNRQPTTVPPSPSSCTNSALIPASIKLAGQVSLLSTRAVDYTQHGEESMRGASANPSRLVLAPVRVVFRAVVVTVMPDAKQVDEASWLALEELVEDALEIRPPALRGQLQLFLHAIEWLPVVRIGPTFSVLGTSNVASSSVTSRITL
jgi:hypothetical protein